MATFGRRLSRLRARAAAAPTTPVEVQRRAATAAALPILSRLNIIKQAMTGQQITQPVISPSQAVAIVKSRMPVGYTAPSQVTSGVPPGREQKFSTQPFITASNAPPGHPLYSPKGAKLPTAVTNGIREFEALPSQPGIGPAVETDSFWRQLVTTGLEKVLGPATTPTRPPPQPGVSTDDDFALAPPAGGMPGWVIPAALIGGFLLLRR